ncbi:hypothetical protein DFH09DRAFT_1284372 [Mycena vulgaris]|nr:hypothetical protein DFH09DRAFT_1284372 [Mycena vulgaris]
MPATSKHIGWEEQGDHYAPGPTSSKGRVDQCRGWSQSESACADSPPGCAALPPNSRSPPTPKRRPAFRRAHEAAASHAYSTPPHLEPAEPARRGNWPADAAGRASHYRPRPHSLRQYGTHTVPRSSPLPIHTRAHSYRLLLSSSPSMPFSKRIIPGTLRAVLRTTPGLRALDAKGDDAPGESCIDSRRVASLLSLSTVHVGPRSQLQRLRHLGRRRPPGKAQVRAAKRGDGDRHVEILLSTPRRCVRHPARQRRLFIRFRLGEKGPQERALVARCTGRRDVKLLAQCPTVPSSSLLRLVERGRLVRPPCLAQHGRHAERGVRGMQSSARWNNKLAGEDDPKKQTKEKRRTIDGRVMRRMDNREGETEREPGGGGSRERGGWGGGGENERWMAWGEKRDCKCQEIKKVERRGSGTFEDVGWDSLRD